MAPPTSEWCDVLCENPTAAPSRRHVHTCTEYENSLYVFGGHDGVNSLSDLYEFSFLSKTWSELPAAPSPRHSHVALVYNHSLYIFAGHNGRSYVSHLDKYNFITKQWSNVIVRAGKPPTPCAYMSAVVYGSSMFCFGGRDLHEFNFSTGRWSHVNVNVTGLRNYHSSMVVYEDSFILFGGSDGSTMSNAVHKFSFTQRKWSTVATKGAAPSPRSGYIALVFSNALYIFGGSSGLITSDLYKLTLTPAENCTWERVPVKGQEARPVQHHAGAVFNSNLVVFGGFNGGAYFNDLTHFSLDGDSTLPRSTVPESTLLLDLRSYVNNETMSDVTFVVEGIPIYAHKLLCMRCNYFKSMFNGKMRESREREVVIDDVRHAIFRLFLEFLYTDEMGDVSVEDAMELFVVADRFGADRLQRLCEQHLLVALCVENAATILYAADLHSASTLRGQCVAFVLSNFDTVSKTLAFAEMSRKNIELVLELLKSRK